MAQSSEVTTPSVGKYGLVLRPALMERLEAGAAGPVSVVAAPAGSGKTVLVRSWLDRRGPEQRAAWVSVERGERDAQRFWGAVVSEVRAAAPAGVTVEALTPTPAFDGEAVVRRLVSELAALKGRLVLVLDDLHEIAGGEILEQLAYFLDHLPAALHLVLITRRDPRLGLHRRRLEGGLAEVRGAELQFTLGETRQMLSAAGIALSDQGLGRLHDRTEGWAAGLRLAAAALAAHPDPERFVAEFSGNERSVAEYLLAEVVDSQPPDVRRLLMRASLLERVNGPLGDLLAGSPGSERSLQALEAIGSFRDADRLDLLLVAGSPMHMQLRSSTLHALLDLGQVTAVRDALAELTEPERDWGELREVRARLALAAGDPAAAVDVLAPTLSGGAKIHRVVVLVRSLVFEALAREALGEPQAAQDAVERALDLAEQDALILPFLHTPSRELLERHPRHRTSHGAFIAEILDVLAGGSPAPDRRPPAPLLDEMSDAELRVLRYLPTNLTAASIAREISVSVNTVKTHVLHIYAKLGAHNRIEAVERARELGLVGRSAHQP